MLSSVYYKTPEQFVKRIRERLNERMDLDNEGEMANAEEYLDSTGVKRSEYLKNAEQNNVGIDYVSYFEGKNVIDLLDIGSS